MHPVAKDILTGLGRVCLRAGARAVDSVLRDAQKGLQRAGLEVQKSRRAVRQVDPDEEEEEEES